jgi:hypothetical protein
MARPNCRWMRLSPHVTHSVVSHCFYIGVRSLPSGNMGVTDFGCSKTLAWSWEDTVNAVRMPRESSGHLDDVAAAYAVVRSFLNRTHSHKRLDLRSARLARE